jgi:hypothetical protein
MSPRKNSWLTEYVDLRNLLNPLSLSPYAQRLVLKNENAVFHSSTFCEMIFREIFAANIAR